jgi:hypothetical protein
MGRDQALDKKVLRPSSFGRFQNTTQLSLEFLLPNSRTRVDQWSTSTQHPTTDTRCGSSIIEASGLRKFEDSRLHKFSHLLPFYHSHSEILNFLPLGPHSTKVTNSGGGTWHV